MIRDFLNGIFAYGKAFRLISRLRLWNYVVIPGLISLVLAGGIFYTAYGLSDDIGHWLVSWYPWETGAGIIESVANVFGGLLVVALGLIVFKQVVLVLSGPFMSPLSEKVEEALTGNPSPKFSLRTTGYQMVRGLRLAIRNLVRELFLTLLLLMLGLIPIFSPFTAIAIFLTQAYYFGFGNLDFTLERHFGVKDSIRFVKRNKGMAMGNGVVTTLALVTVIGVVFILPLGVVAATIEANKKL